MKVDDLVIKMTNQCNLSCPYCYANATNEPDENALTVEQIKEAIDIVKPTRVAFTGGEPLLRYDDVVELAHYAYEKVNAFERGVRIETNGTIPVDFDDFQVNGDTKPFVFTTTLDGFKELNDSRRGEGTYDVVTNFVKKSVNKGYWTMIKAVFPDEYLIEKEDYLYDFGKFCRTELGLQRIRYGHVKNSGRGAYEIGNDYMGNCYKMIANSAEVSKKIERETNYVSPDNYKRFIVPELCMTCVYKRHDIYLDTNGILSIGCAFVNFPICHYTKFTQELYEDAFFLMKRLRLGAKDGQLKLVNKIF